MTQRGRHDYIHLRGGHRATLDPSFAQCKAWHVQPLESLHQFRKRHTGIYKGAERHVAADSGKTIEVKMHAHVCPFAYPRKAAPSYPRPLRTAMTH